MNEIIGGLGLTGNLAAVVWLIYGGFRLAQTIRNGGKAPNAIGPQLDQLRRDLVEEIRREREGLSRELEDAVTHLALRITKERHDG